MSSNNKLIRAGDLFEAVCKDTSIRGSAFAAIRRHIDATPAVSAEPIVYAKWKDGHCTNCGVQANVQNIGFNCSGNGAKINYQHTKRCHECGAKMDGDDA